MKMKKILKIDKKLKNSFSDVAFEEKKNRKKYVCGFCGFLIGNGTNTGTHVGEIFLFL
jgi:hypothetical protein